jgi:hypothetical protein
MTEETTLLTFPCDFPIKIMGKVTASFQDEIIAIVHKHYPDLNADLFRTNTSKNGNFLAISVTVHALDQASLDALYQDLSQHPDIKMVL